MSLYPFLSLASQRRITPVDSVRVQSRMTAPMPLSCVLRSYIKVSALVRDFVEGLGKYRTNGRHVWQCLFRHAHPAIFLTCRQQACEICRRA